MVYKTWSIQGLFIGVSLINESGIRRRSNQSIYFDVFCVDIYIEILFKIYS